MIALLLLSRAVHWSSGMLLVGIVAFRWLVLLPGMASASDAEWARCVPFFRRLNALFLGAFAALVLSGVGLFWAVAAGMSATSLREALDWQTWGTVLERTRFGGIWAGRIVLGVLLATLLAWPGRNWLLQRRRSAPEAGMALAVTALLISLAWTGHAATAGGGSLWRTGADALHLFTAAIWPTGLLFFAMFPGFVAPAGDALRFELVSRVVSRFSNVSLLAVLALAGTGTVNAWSIVGSFSAMIFTSYGQILCLKLSLFLIILLVAAWNRFRLLPSLFRSREGAVTSLVLRRLRNFVWTEWALAVAIILVVAMLGVTPPPR